MAFVIVLTMLLGSALGGWQAEAAETTARSVYSSGYGPGRESCTTRGKVIATGSNLETSIEAGRAGDTFLLRGGTHVVPRNIQFPRGTSAAPIILKPYNCERVILRLRDKTLEPNDYTVIAGLQIVADASTQSTITVNGNSSDARQGMVIRNNTFSGPAKTSHVRLVGNVRDVDIIGNDISHALSSNVTIGLLASGSSLPDDIRVVHNRFRDCGQDCFLASRVGTFVVEDNAFEGDTKENYLDIKGLGKDSFIRGNTFHCAHSVSACILLHKDSASGAEGSIEDNMFTGCPPRNRLQVRVTREGERGTYHFRRNTFDLDSAGCRALAIGLCAHCEIAQNTFYHGELEIGSEGWPTNTQIRSNIFYRSHIDDRTAGGSYTCANNGMYNTSGRFKTPCSNTITSDPRFVDPGAGNFAVRNPEYLREAADGSTLGAW